MKTRETTPGKTYSVHTSSGCTVSDKNGWSKTIDAPDGYFTAHAGEVTIDGDDAADIREVFNLAPYQKLRLLGVVGGNAGDNGGLPAGYKRVEYLESTGTQYINTGVEVQSGLAFECEFFDLNTPDEQGDARYIFGGFGNSLAWSWGFFNPPDSTVVAWTCTGEYNGAWRSYIPIDELKANKHSLLVKEGSATLDGIECFERVNSNDVYSAPSSIGLYGHLRDYAPVRINKFKIWSFNILKNNSPVLKFVPCIGPTGAPCMFDLVTRKPFYNAGTGDFLYPTESTTYALRRVLPDWGKLTETGLCRLYHAPAGYKGELIDYAMENGYKPIVEPEKPEGGYWAPRWTETEDEIVLEWVETEPPMDEFGLPDEDLTETE